MATLDLDNNRATYQIRSYQPGKIRINDLTFTQSVIVSAEKLIPDWPPQTLAELTPESLRVVLPLQPAVVLIGTGNTSAYVAPQCYGELINAGIGVEVMNTRSACMTFNALSAEGRAVVGVLLL